MSPATRVLADFQRNSFELATYAVALLGIVCGSILGQDNPLAAIVFAALLCGWAEVDGQCGASHVASITPLRALDPTKKLWLRSAFGYTLGGLISASIVGAALGGIGYLLGLDSSNSRIVAGCIAALLALREVFAPQIWLPQAHRQTHRMWVFEFGFGTAATMWGIHIGISFATVIKHGGFYAIVATATCMDPVIAAVIFGAYWFGRALPIWVLPLVTPNSMHKHGDRMGELVLASDVACRIAAALGLAMIAVAALVG